MRKKIKIFSILGFIFTSGAGVLLHFLYEWCQKSYFAALFGSANESTWEHLKLFFIPFFAFSIIEYCVFGRKLENFFTVKLFSSIIGMGITVMLFYTYTGIIGMNVDFLNIAIFFASCAAAYIYSYYRLAVSPKRVHGWIEALSALGYVLILGLFIIFTFSPPEIPLFKDPISGKFGPGK